MNKKYGVLLTALFTIGNTVYADEILYPDEDDTVYTDEILYPDEDNFEDYAEYKATDSAMPAGGISAAAHALLSVDVDHGDDMPIYINTVLGFKTTGASMAKFPVSVDYDGNGTWDDEAVWLATLDCKGRGGKAVGTGWSLEVCDTWKNLWVLTVSEDTPIKSIKIEPIIDEDRDGTAAVFDIITMGVKKEQTLGSSNGQKISEVVHIDHDSGLITATYSRPILLLGGQLPDQQDLYGVLTLDFDEPLSGILNFSADTDNVELPLKGCCCLDFLPNEGFGGYSGEYPLYLNEDGNNTHILPEDVEPDKGEINKYLVCYDHKYPTQLACESALGTTRNIPFDGQKTEVNSTHWFVNKDKFDDLWCPELQEELDPLLPFDVPLLAKGVKLEATKNKDGGVDLKLTTDSEKDTAALAILRGNKLDNEGTAIKTVPKCRFASGGSPYTCTDKVVGDNYRVLEIEYTGRLIVFEPVTVK